MIDGQAFGQLTVAAPEDDGEACDDPRQGLPDTHGHDDGQVADDPPEVSRETTAWTCEACGRQAELYARGRCKKCYEAFRSGRLRAGDWWRTRGPRGAKSRAPKVDPSVMAAVEALEAYRQEAGRYPEVTELLAWLHGREARQVAARGIRIGRETGLVRLEIRPVLHRIRRPSTV